MNIQSIAADIAYIKEAVLSNKRVLSFEEAAHYIGFSQSYLYKLTAAGIIPYSKPNGKTLFFDREKLDSWMLSNSTASLEEKEEQASTYMNTQMKKL